MKINIIEVDQWTWTGLAQQMKDSLIKFDELTSDSASGGDSEAVKKLGIAKMSKKTVEDTASPRIGRVWIKADEDGYARTHKTNFDSSG